MREDYLFCNWNLTRQISPSKVKKAAGFEGPQRDSDLKDIPKAVSSAAFKRRISAVTVRVTIINLIRLCESFHKPLANDHSAYSSLRLRFHRKSRGLPDFPASHQGASQAPARLLELQRHPGAGCFVRSGAKGHQPSLWGQSQSSGAFNYSLRSQSYSAFGLEITSFITAIGANI